MNPKETRQELASVGWRLEGMVDWQGAKQAFQVKRSRLALRSWGVRRGLILGLGLGWALWFLVAPFDGSLGSWVQAALWWGGFMCAAGVCAWLACSWLGERASKRACDKMAKTGRHWVEQALGLGMLDAWNVLTDVVCRLEREGRAESGSGARADLLDFLAPEPLEAEVLTHARWGATEWTRHEHAWDRWAWRWLASVSRDVDAMSIGERMGPETSYRLALTMYPALAASGLACDLSEATASCPARAGQPKRL
jgi:hypothetical protein